VLSRDDFRTLKADFVGIQNLPASARKDEKAAGPVYDLSGRRIGNGKAPGGIRIQNGKKYYTK
ncbi:MAG: hypothetical protein IJR87_04780, partial [Bacteroidaceae bacterium]|nr:hypothetical protein [Bacteroidaceae bacterium]